MTREGVLSQISDALASAGKTAPRALLQALRDAGQWIEDHPPLVVALDEVIADANTAGLPPSPPSPFQLLAAQCASELEEAAGLEPGVMDSENRVRAINAQRVGAMQSVAARLREVA